MNHKYSLKKNHEIQKLVSKPNKSVGSKYYVIYYQKAEGTKIAVSVSKKIGKAIFRNYQKRITREILRLHFNHLQNKEMLVVVKANSLALSFSEKEREIERLLKTIEGGTNEH